VRFRRRRLPEELWATEAAFAAVLEEVEPAKAALTECMPTTRLPGRPLPDALAEYARRLERAVALMPAWRRSETQEVWIACETGLRDALMLARRLREEAPDLGGFEGLLGTIEALMDPLDPFESAARRFDQLRV
jgi:hypothetical protein